MNELDIIEAVKKEIAESNVDLGDVIHVDKETLETCVRQHLTPAISQYLNVEMDYLDDDGEFDVEACVEVALRKVKLG
jgi:hypothetical protein